MRNVNEHRANPTADAARSARNQIPVPSWISCRVDPAGARLRSTHANRAAEPDAGPTQVSVGIWIVDINNIDSAQQSFGADVFIALSWKDPRLAHTGTGVAHYSLDQIWNPRTFIVNETNSVSHRLPESVEADPDGTVTYRQRFVGAFTQALLLKSFPFDKQTFRVHLAALKYTPSEVNFVPDQKWKRPLA